MTAFVALIDFQQWIRIIRNIPPYKIEETPRLWYYFLINTRFKGGFVLEVIIQEPNDGENEKIIVKVYEVSPRLLNVLDQLKDNDDVLAAYMGNEMRAVAIKNIYYIESVDNKTWLYCESEIYESKHKLYELEEALNASAFLRISKSSIVNLRKIKSLTTALRGRLEAILINEEVLIVSRSYVDKLKKRLGL